jgi:hypothetical protein
MKLGSLGLQVDVKSEKTFGRLDLLGAEPVQGTEFFARYRPVTPKPAKIILKACGG